MACALWGLVATTHSMFRRCIHVGAYGCSCPFSVLCSIPPFRSAVTHDHSTLDGHLEGFPLGLCDKVADEH